MIQKYLEQANELDSSDVLKKYRDKFFTSGENLIYLDGNSLGRLPVETIRLMEQAVKHQWGERLIRSWNENWINLPERTASKIAQIVGARDDEIFVGDSTSINLYKLVFGVLKTSQNKSQILTDNLNFPSDHYILQGIVENHFPNYEIIIAKSNDNISIETNQLVELINEKTALLTLSHAAYKSSFLYDMKKITKAAQEKGAIVLWDLSHSAGVVPIKLKECNADLAIGCTYKYLNGGPGAPAFLYIRKDLQEKLINPIWGWFGDQRPFEFNLEYKHADSINKFGVGTPNILSLAAIEPGLNIIIEAGIENIRKKSIDETNFLIELIKQFLLPIDFSISSPLKSDLRGSHISIKHDEAFRISKAMIAPKNNGIKIIPDFRPPNNIRLGIAPLYTSFKDIFNSIIRIREIVETGEYKLYPRAKEDLVT
ncbi:MAG: kynureninase [Melioribacteraceae bacterium]|nr:kynureninase [Melioribacteraceae bacterium]MCF8354477.1 kynureninase [Melioribacteraceae bacterium]MCF8394087.1 kynureninase [Melioribacteraceae bacterium]MCF8419860.1 kynureninase [Melioribacteraceae bacterium]